MSEEFDIEDEGELNISSEGFKEIPEELKDAPEEIKSVYIKWLEMTDLMKNDKSRYFSFVNQVTKDIEHIDCCGFVGVPVKRALAKNIGDTDLVRMKEICQVMDDYKSQKARYKFKWLSYVRPLRGKSVYDWKKAEILDLFGHYCTHEEVKIKIGEWGYTTGIDTVYKFFLRNKDIIEKKRTEFIRSSKDHYLATDAGRMETLAMLHAKFVKLFTDISNLPDIKKDDLLAYSREIRAIVEQARKEIKGDQILLTIDGKIDINASIQASQTIQEISRKIPINMIPVYLVAAKMNLNPNMIMTSLVNSFYKDFNGFKKLNNHGQPPQTMDLIRNYDWNEISTYQKTKPLERTDDLVEYEEIPFKQAELVKTKRQQLLEMIAKEQEQGKAK